MTEPKPCPGCGFKPDANIPDHQDQGCGGFQTRIECEVCGVCGPWSEIWGIDGPWNPLWGTRLSLNASDGVSQAIDRWNALPRGEG